MKKKHYRCLGVSVLLLLLCLKAQAQQLITGTVKDLSGSNLPGVSVLIKNSTVGTVTDADGKFSISARPEDVLTFSFIGYEPQEVAVGKQSTISVNLKEDVRTLEEVVVIGYGEVKRRDLTGAVSSVKGEDLKKTNAITVEQALQGRVPGMIVQQISGQPGGGVSVQIRGITSLSGGSPLYVIDGIRYSSNFSGDGGLSPLAGINTSEIESIEVLKGASAT